MKKLNITFCSFPDYSGNAKALYEYMEDRFGTQMNYIWVVRNKEIKENLISNNIKTVLLGSKEYFDYVKTTNVFFTTHCDITGDKPKGSLYIELWHGVGPKSLGFLTKNTTEETLSWFEHIKRTIDYMIVPSPLFATIFSTQFNIKPNRILDIGMPKLDYFVYSDGKKNLSKIIGRDLSKYKKILYYMPTFRKGCGRENESDVNTTNIFNFKKYEEKKL